MTDSKNVLTIATGKQLYLHLAINLARSFYYWNKTEAIDFYLATDMPDEVPDDVKPYVNIIKLKEGELGHGFSPKLHLDKLAPEGHTLFIDSDCLIFGKLSGVFELFKNMPVSVVGRYISEGEWFGDIKTICAKFGVPHIPKFNGGIYYLEKGEIASRVYGRARDIEKRYDEIGFVRLRNRPNDEVIMALAMQIENLKPIKDDGNILSDPQACPGKYKMDIETGKTMLVNPLPPNPLHRDWYPFHEVSPLIIHFLGAFSEEYPYKREVAKLPFLLKNKLGFIQNFKIQLSIEYPGRLKLITKNFFRPLYHKIFGFRKIKISNRVS